MSIVDDPVPAAMSHLLELFATELADVRFGELDRVSLEKAAEKVRVAAAELGRAEAAAEAARAVLESAREALLQKGQRALAHARIHAEGTPELEQRLQAISLTRGTRRMEPMPVGVAEALPRRRGRPPKATAAEASGTLPLSGGSRSASGAAANGEEASEEALGDA
jgi:hypothetical protein